MKSTYLRLLAVAAVAAPIWLQPGIGGGATAALPSAHASHVEADAGGASHLSTDPDAKNIKSHDLAGNQGEPQTEGDTISADPDQAAYEQLQHRAYPADSLPASVTIASQLGFQTYGENKQYTGASNQNNPFVWSLIGPTHATQPQQLSFSGAQYHMAGRVTAMQISPTCTSSRCRLWVAEAGGGIWRTDNPLSPNPYWVFVSQSFATNAIGTIDRDPNDPTGNTLYAGTGEENASGDSEAGVGIYKTTDGGDTWTFVPGSQLFATRSISKIVIPPGHPNTMYVGVARGVRGVSSVPGGAVSRNGNCVQFPTVLACRDGPDQAPLGLFESADGGATFTRIWDSNNSVRGVNDVGLDPSNPTTVYAAAFQQGIWRCAKIDGCDTTTPLTGLLNFQQVFHPSSPLQNTDRTQFDLTTVPSGQTGVAEGTRIYAVDGAVGAAFARINGSVVQVGYPSQVWRADGANTLTASALNATEGDPNAQGGQPNAGAGWARKSSRTRRPASDPYRPAYNPCEGQCWYDEDVYTPPGNPNVVYVIGSLDYGELHGPSNGRGVILSLTAGDPDPSIGGGNFSDLTWDDTPHSQPDQTHPDQHAIVTPNDQPFLYFEGSDGGMIRSDGTFDDASGLDPTQPSNVPNTSDCVQYHVNDPDNLVLCQRVLARVPHQLYDIINEGLSSLQFQSVSINPQRPKEDVQGGTQDNGTFAWNGQPTTWYEDMYGDGGQSGYNYCNASIRFNTFFGYYTDENFKSGQVDKWVVTSGPLSSANNGENQSFYIPEVTDYTNCGPISNFPGLQTAASQAANTNQTAFAQQNGGNQLGELGFQYAGLQHVWRTVDNGGPEAYLETNCPEFTSSGDDPRCGDWQPLGDPAYTGPGHKTALEPGDLTGTQYGQDRLAGTVAAVERNPGNSNEMWAATSFGRVFVSFNVNDPNPATVQFCRIDQLALATGGPDALPPPRFISSIYPDPNNPNRAWLSYDGYNSNTKDQPGHVFEVTFTQPAGSPTACPTAAVWRDLHVEQSAPGTANPPNDIPITDLVRDDFTGDLYAATDFGVLRGTSPDGGVTYAWTKSGVNLPMVEVPGLTIDPCTRLLYAATHGRSIWRMFLPAVQNAPSQGCPRTP